MDNFHTPVLLEEAIEFLNVKPNEKYIDATLGGGGHSGRIVELGGQLLSIDQDEEAIAHVARKFEIRSTESETPQNFSQSSKLAGQTIRENSKYKIVKIKNNWQVVKENFDEIEEIAKETGFTDAAGVLFDLGLSSHQLRDKSRGFSFDSDEELDMRMDKDLSVKASVLVNGLTKKELERIFLEYGEEPLAWKIAREIERVRVDLPIHTCRQLAEICEKVKSGHKNFGQTDRKIHPATQVFQALRIVVNDELGSLKKGLLGAINILKSHGRIVVISFHSLEDRVAKKTFSKWEQNNWGNIVNKELIRPSPEEVSKNPRSRSAKMRVFEKK